MKNTTTQHKKKKPEWKCFCAGVCTCSHDTATTTVRIRQNYYRFLGEAISLMRESRGLTQSQLARKLRTKQSAIARIEKSTKPSLVTLFRIAKVLGYDMTAPSFGILED